MWSAGQSSNYLPYAFESFCPLPTFSVGSSPDELVRYFKWSIWSGWNIVPCTVLVNFCQNWIPWKLGLGFDPMAVIRCRFWDQTCHKKPEYWVSTAPLHLRLLPSGAPLKQPTCRFLRMLNPATGGGERGAGVLPLSLSLIKLQRETNHLCCLLLLLYL